MSQSKGHEYLKDIIKTVTEITGGAYPRKLEEMGELDEQIFGLKECNMKIEEELITTANAGDIDHAASLYISIRRNFAKMRCLSARKLELADDLMYIALKCQQAVDQKCAALRQFLEDADPGSAAECEARILREWSVMSWIWRRGALKKTPRRESLESHSAGEDAAPSFELSFGKEVSPELSTKREMSSESIPAKGEPPNLNLSPEKENAPQMITKKAADTGKTMPQAKGENTESNHNACQDLTITTAMLTSEGGTVVEKAAVQLEAKRISNTSPSANKVVQSSFLKKIPGVGGIIMHRLEKKESKNIKNKCSSLMRKAIRLCSLRKSVASCASALQIRRKRDIDQQISKHVSSSSAVVSEESCANRDLIDGCPVPKKRERLQSLRIRLEQTDAQVSGRNDHVIYPKISNNEKCTMLSVPAYFKSEQPDSSYSAEGKRPHKAYCFCKRECFGKMIGCKDAKPIALSVSNRMVPLSLRCRRGISRERLVLSPV